MSTQLLLFSPLQKAIKTKKKESWNLQGRYQFQGLPISVENKAGSWRRSKIGEKPKWKTKMGYDYGYVRNTLAKDGDAVDVYVNRKSKGLREDYHGKNEGLVATDVYVIHQKKIWHSGKWPNGICPDCKKHHSECTCTKYYDEDKVMLGFDSKDDAVKAYLKQYDSKRFLGPVSTYTIDEFKTALKRSFGKKLPSKKPEHEHWEGVDLDGTLAKDDGWKGIKHIGEPVKKTVEMINKKLEQGKKVKIFTARAYDPKAIPPIKEWLKQNNLPLLEITNKKDPGMVNIYDDRAVQVRKNTGNLVKGFSDSKEIVVKCSESAVNPLLDLLETLQAMGSHGASRDIKIEDYGSHGFDGDGSDKIGSIKVGGIMSKHYRKKKKVMVKSIQTTYYFDLDKSYGAEMKPAIWLAQLIKEIREENPNGLVTTEKMREFLKSCGESGKSMREPKNVVVKKSMLGTAATAGEPGVMYSFLRENILRGKGEKQKAVKMPKDQVTVEDFELTGENSPETTRNPKKVVVKGILYKSYNTNQKYGGHVKSEYWGSVLKSPDEYKMEEARKNREEIRRSREAMQDASIYPRYDMYETLEKAEDDYEMMEINNKEIPAETKHDYVVRMLREASGNQVDAMFNANQYSEMYKAFVKAHTRKGKRVGPYFTARTKKVTTVKHSKLLGLDLDKKQAKEKIKALHKKKEHHDLHVDAANEMKAKVEAHKQSGNTHYKVGEKEHHVDKVLKDLDDHIDHHTNENKSHDNHINKIEKRHETVAKQWEKKKVVKKEKESAKKEAKAYDKSKALIRDTLGSDKLTADDVHKVMFAAKKKGDDSYAHMNNFLMGTRPDLKEAVNQAGIKLDAMPDEPKKAAKKPWEMSSEETFKNMPASEFNKYAKQADPEKFEWYKKNPLMDAKTRHEDLHESIVREAMKEGKIPKKADVIDQMIKDGEHEGEKFSDDLMGVLKRMNGEKKPEKKVVVKKEADQKKLEKLEAENLEQYWRFYRTEKGKPPTKGGEIAAQKVKMGKIIYPWQVSFSEAKKRFGIPEKTYIKHVKTSIAEGKPVPYDVRNQVIITVKEPTRTPKKVVVPKEKEMGNVRHQSFLDTVEEPEKLKGNAEFMIWTQKRVSEFKEKEGRVPDTKAESEEWQNKLSAYIRDYADKNMSDRAKNAPKAQKPKVKAEPPKMKVTHQDFMDYIDKMDAEKEKQTA